MIATSLSPPPHNYNIGGRFIKWDQELSTSKHKLLDDASSDDWSIGVMGHFGTLTHFLYQRTTFKSFPISFLSGSFSSQRSVEFFCRNHRFLRYLDISCSSCFIPCRSIFITDGNWSEHWTFANSLETIFNQLFCWSIFCATGPSQYSHWRNMIPREKFSNMIQKDVLWICISM